MPSWKRLYSIKKGVTWLKSHQIPFGSTTASLFHFYAEFQEENVCLNQVNRSKGLLAPQRNIGSASVG